MKKFKVYFYQEDDNSNPIEEFLMNLNNKMRAKALSTIELLQEKGNTIREPYSKYLTNEIFELRIKISTDTCRILYFFDKEKIIVLTNGFIKKENKTPKKEIQLAIKRKNNYFLRKECQK